MRIRAGYRIVYDTPGPTPMLMMLSVRPERAPDLETPDFMLTDPYVPIRTYVDAFGNICTRLVAPAGRTARCLIRSWSPRGKRLSKSGRATS